jgi:hypothetical protein
VKPGMATIFWRDEAAGEYDPFGGRRDVLQFQYGVCEAGAVPLDLTVAHRVE